MANPHEKKETPKADQERRDKLDKAILTLLTSRQLGINEVFEALPLATVGSRRQLNVCMQRLLRAGSIEPLHTGHKRPYQTTPEGLKRLEEL